VPTVLPETHLPLYERCDAAIWIISHFATRVPHLLRQSDALPLVYTSSAVLATKLRLG
jgi:hypothetical protein